VDSYSSMNQIDLKKLIGTFLLASTILSSVILGTSAYLSPSSSISKEKATNPVSPFAEKLPQGSSDSEIATLLAAQEHNATHDLANLLAQEIIKKNPEGPEVVSGEPTVVLPGSAEEMIDTYIESNPISPDVLSLYTPTPKVNVRQNSSEQDITRYLTEASSISNRILSGSTGEAPAGQEGEWLLAAQLNFNNAAKDLGNLEVPAELAPLHTSLIDFINTPSGYLKLITQDPASAAALQLTFERTLAEKAIVLQQQAQALSTSTAGIYSEQNTALIQKILGIHTVYATGFPVLDIANFVQAVVDFVMKYKDILEKIAIGYLKNTLLRQLEQQVLVWVAGGPKPQFVTDWKGFMEKTVNEGAGAVIAQSIPQLCGGAGSIGSMVGLGDVAEFIRQVLSPINQGGYYGDQYIGACTLQNVVQNIEDFKRDLRNGGWLAYGAMFEPQNSLYGSLIVLRDKQRQEASKQKEAEATNAAAGGGFSTPKVCDNGQPPLEVDKKKIGAGADGFATVVVIPAGTCEDGSTPIVTTPGRVAGDLVSKSLGGVSDRITSATDWPALGGALAEAAISNLTKKATRGLFSMIAGKSSGNKPPVIEPPSPDIRKQAEQILTQKQATLDYARRLATTIDATSGVLRNTVAMCTDPTVTTGAQLTLAGISGMTSSTAAKINQLRPQVAALEKFIQDIPTKNYTLAQLNSQFGTYEAAQQEFYAFARNTDGSDKLGTMQDLYISASTVFSASCQGNINLNPEPTPSSTPPTP
jgi:hypothetical protein